MRYCLDNTRRISIQVGHVETGIFKSHMNDKCYGESLFDHLL